MDQLLKSKYAFLLLGAPTKISSSPLAFFTATIEVAPGWLLPKPSPSFPTVNLQVSSLKL